MEVQGLSCHGCGSTDVEFDPTTRKIHCNQCGREEYYSRAQLGATGKVSFVKDNAIRFFKEGNRVNARKFASDVLNIMLDNATALFIIAYCDEYGEMRSSSISDFFRKVQDIPLEYNEVRELIDLFEASLYNMRDYEEDMVVLMIKNMQSEQDRKDLENFIDTVSPYCIAHYPSEDFLSEERCGLYCDIASNCNIPKTCYALLKGIRTNPDSPYVTHGFYLKAKTGYFRQHYVQSVGKVIQAMKESAFKTKFLAGYRQMVNQFDKDAQAVS